MSEEFPYALFVEGEWDPKTPKLRNKFIIYFQSKKSNGGDCSVEISEGQRVVVRFKKEEVRQNVLEKETHEIQLGKVVVKLSVSLPPHEEPATPTKSDQSATKSQEKSPARCESSPSEETQEKEENETCNAVEDSGDLSRRSVVLENIQNMNQEYLGMLVENVVKDDPESKEFSIEDIPESNCAVITFTSRKCAVNFIMSCPSNSVFKKKKLEVRPLERTTKVKAEGLPPNMSADYIMLYFEKYGDIKDGVEMLEEGQSALITFEDPAVVHKVLTAQHQIKRQHQKLPIKVFPYYESLATALYGKDRPTVCLPEAFIENIDRSVWKYFQEHRESLDQIKQDMSQHFCQVDFKDPAVRISPLPSLLHQGAQTRKLIQSWREKVSAQFTTVMSKYKSYAITIQRDAWDESIAEIHKALQSEPVTLFCNKEEGAVTVAGLSEDVIRTANVVQSTINQITQRIQREKGSVTDEILMDPVIYEIVMKCDLEREINNSFPELELNYHIHNQKITFYGLKQEVLESKNKILQHVIDLRKKVVEVHPSILEFLAKRNLHELCIELFLNKGISASLEVLDNRATAIAKTENYLRDSEKQLKTLLHHECVDVEDSSVLMRAEWHDLVNNINNTFNSPVRTVLINTSGNKVVVSGFADKVQVVHDEVSDYVRNTSQITETLVADNIVVKFIHECKKQDWFEKVKNKVTADFKDGTVSLSGPSVHVSQCLSFFNDLVSSVHHCNFKVAKPGAKKFFKRKESDYAILAMKETGCLIELVDERDDFGVSAAKKGVTTPDGVEIVVSKGDMSSYSGDAVVNAANENLDLSMGLSKALSDAAGPELQAACNKIMQTRKRISSGDAVVTKAGQLRCKYIIHAVGPRFDHSDALKSIGLLKKSVTKSLNLADRENCESIAIPAISSGNLGFPLDLCADTIVAALKEFFMFVGGDSCLKKIHLIDNNDKTVQALEAAVQKVYGDKSTKQEVTFKSISSYQPQNLNTASSSSQVSPQSVKTNEGLTITLSKCNIQDTNVDVVVNSMTSDLNLNHGAIPVAILKAAGPQLQTLLNQQATAPANVGDVFITAGCNLKNKLVFHAVAPHYKGQGSEQKALEDIVEKCLNHAEQQQQGSIVFPAIGTGGLGFPKALVASLMLDTVLQFSKKRSSKHVQEVMIALHPTDTQTIQAFTDEFNKKFNIQPSSTSASTQQQSKGLFSKVTSPKSGIYEITVGGVVLQVLSGDITTETTDVIVNSTNENFNLKSGVSKAILDAAGPNVEAECQQLGAQKNNGLIMTQQGNLKCKKILHISAKNDPATIHKRVKQALKMSVKQNFASISFPAFGTGQGGMNAGQAADAMLDAIEDFVTQNPQSSLKVVHMVIFQAPMLTDFHQSMLKKESTDKQKKESTFSRFTSFAKSFFTPWFRETKQEERKDFVIEGKVVDPACFSVCGPSQAAVDQAKTWIEKIISDEQVFEPIIDPVILDLSDKDQQRIQELQGQLDVTVRIEYKVKGGAAGDSEEAKLTVEGLSRDVLKAASEIQTMLKRAREEAVQKKGIKLASELVDWQYEQGGQYHSFDPLTNFHLEEAFSKNSHHVDITLNSKTYKVSLPDGTAVSGSNQMKIKRIDRRDTSCFSLPQEWETMPADALYKVFPLQTSSSEYNEVLQQFQKTCRNNVVKIERIQNPGMWRKYQSNKQIMEQKNGHTNNERKLFHGTREETMDHINKSGFNRSFAGFNAAAYGKGTYFAVNASYSASNTYSVPNQQGQKRMYLCRVLTGDYTVGNQTMVVPPAKSTSSTDLYDTVVDNANTPSMFVVFRDDHAYPDYLITFT